MGRSGADAVRPLTHAVGAALLSEEGHPHPVNLETSPEDFLMAANRHRVVALLAQQAHAIGLPPVIADPLQSWYQDSTIRALLMSRLTVQMLQILEVAGVPALVMKGIPLSLQTTRTLNARSTGDVDVLVAPDSMPAAHAALLQAGFTASKITYPGDSAAWRHARWVHRETPYVGPLCIVDMHWRIAPERRLFPEPEALIARGEVVHVQDQPVRTLHRGDALAASCLHLHADGYKELRYLVDLRRLSRGLPEVPADHSPQLRRLVGDTLEFAKDLLPGWPWIDLEQHTPGDSSWAWSQWNRHRDSVGQQSPMTASDYWYSYRSLLRYAPSRSEASAQFASILAVSANEVDPDAGALGFASAIQQKLRRARRHLATGATGASVPAAGDGHGHAP